VRTRVKNHVTWTRGPNARVHAFTFDGSTHPRRRIVALALTVLAAVTAAALLALNAQAASDALKIPASKLVTVRVLSSRADLVSGGEALVGVFLPAGADPAGVRVTWNAKDVTRDFGPGRLAGLMTGTPAHNLLGIDPRANALVGLVSGLALGRNLLMAVMSDGYGAHIVIINHPNGGPVFSGPEVQPWTCNAGAVDAQCDRKPSYQYYYVPASANGGPQAPNVMTPDPRFQPYDPASPPPSSAIAQTTTDAGQTVPFVVRVEPASRRTGDLAGSVTTVTA
jgi:Tannase-like family of unknown function (DUF6351)